MKTIETMSGEIYEICESRKEILHEIENMFLCCDTNEEKMDVMTDCTLWVQYKDGSHYYVAQDEIEGTFKKINIKAVAITNPCTTVLWGDYKIINIDDTEQEYSEENDSEETIWIEYIA